MAAAAEAELRAELKAAAEEIAQQLERTARQVRTQAVQYDRIASGFGITYASVSADIQTRVTIGASMLQPERLTLLAATADVDRALRSVRPSAV